MADATEWASLEDPKLLALRIRELGLCVEGTEIDARVKQLYDELEKAGLVFKPRIYLGDEWFSPEGMNAIAVPFFLAHSRLKALEKTMMLEVEGGDPSYCMKLLRHEAGHCFDHCYGFSRRKKWEKIFGSPHVDYAPETYRPRPYSRSYVKNLKHWYAQSHPDEDFAETFAVWLDPGRDWRKEYKHWPAALEKLKYVDSLAAESRGLKVRAVGGRLPCSASSLTTTLEKYYLKRRRENQEEYPDFYDEDLKKVFSGASDLSKREYSAARFMNRNRKHIVAAVSWSCRERKFTVDGLVRRLTRRCEELELRIGKDEVRTLIEVSSFLTSLVKNYLFTGKFRRKL